MTEPQESARSNQTSEASDGEWFRPQEPDQRARGRRCRPVTHEFQVWDYLQGGVGKGSKIDTGNRAKFAPGFYRRRWRDINPGAEREQHEARQGERRAAAEAGRRRLMLEQDQKNGFNVISGSFDKVKAAKNSTDMPPQRRHLDDKPSQELVNEGFIELRSGTSRYYCPVTKLDQLEFRRTQLAREGINAPRCSSLLGIGRADVPSYGVRDQFEHSLYEAGTAKPPSGRRHMSVSATAEAHRRGSWSMGADSDALAAAAAAAAAAASASPRASTAASGSARSARSALVSAGAEMTRSRSSSRMSAPASSRGAPALSRGAVSSRGSLTSSRGAPASSRGAPASSRGAPASSRGAPASSRGAPASSRGASRAGSSASRREVLDMAAEIASVRALS